MQEEMNPQQVAHAPERCLKEQCPEEQCLEEQCTEEQHQVEKRKERRLFIFIIVFLFPILTVALVSAMGFSIWFYQLIAGPPGAS